MAANVVFTNVLNIEINNMSKENENLNVANVSKSLAPHRCPVCNGNGLVPNVFYMQTSGYWATTSITPETCRSCNGTGIVWS